MERPEARNVPKLDWFTTTQWSLVSKAAQPNAPETLEALNQLCQAYWFPVFAHVRMTCSGFHDAEDLTQAFFAWFLEKKHLMSADPAKGRFRSFLLAYLKRFLSNERARASCLKRGGHCAIVAIDKKTAEGLAIDPSHTLTPELVFERNWALTLLRQAMDRLREECSSSGKGRIFDLVEKALSGDKADFSYAKAAAQLEMNEGALRTAVSRLRERHGRILREEIARTVANPREVDEEIQHLLQVFGD